jgi:hypothetical protein
MKYAVLATMGLMLLNGPEAWSQSESELAAHEGSVGSGMSTAVSLSTPAVRAGFYAPFAFHPGMRLSVPWGLAVRDRQLRGPVAGRQLQLVTGPYLWVATRPGSYTASGVGGEFGVRLLTPRRGRFHEFVATAGYVARSEVTVVRVELSSGDQTALRELRHLVVPALRYVFGRQPRQRVGWYVGGSVGRYFSAQVSGGVYFDLELGLQIRVGRSTRGEAP